MTLNFLKGIGNRHLDVARLCWFASVAAGISFTGAHLLIDHRFNIIEFGTGMGLLLAGGGSATALKDTAVAKAAAIVPPSEDRPQ
ncbi:hypothetical protein [Flavisphingomonas formosensis]|uniref:hypothetical protein n=1 Tax=Flavisphingomonas formosensis TaxID=861534 RepID=UPI0012F99351|nr:hypothetical protein [Sphingomonas formosensis]